MITGAILSAVPWGVFIAVFCQPLNDSAKKLLRFSLNPFLRFNPKPLVIHPDCLNNIRSYGFKILCCFRQVKPFLQDRMLNNISELFHNSIMELMVCRDQQPIPWFLSRCKNKHKPTTKINRKTSEHGFFQIAGFLHEGFNNPQERMGSGFIWLLSR